jgi:hypothetical protein
MPTVAKSRACKTGGFRSKSRSTPPYKLPQTDRPAACSCRHGTARRGRKAM